MRTIKTRVGLLAVLASLAVGCSKNPDPPPQQAAPQGYPGANSGYASPAQPQAAPQPAQAPVQPGQPAAPTPGQQAQANQGQGANPLGQMLGALSAMGQAAQQAQQQQKQRGQVQMVPWQNLAQALPVTAPGWTASKPPTGESTQAMGISVSQAEASLVQGKMRADVEIIDTSMNPLVAMPFNMARTMKIDSSEERMGPIDFGTYPGTQRFDKRSKTAEVMAMVNNRIMITVKVHGATSEAPAVGLTQYVNFNHLASLTGS